MRFKQLLAILAFGALTGSQVQAQCNIKETSKADFAYNQNLYSLAIELYGKANGKVKDKGLKACIQYQIAKCYLKLNDYKKTEASFKRIKLAPDDPMFYYDYGVFLKSQARYEEAKEKFDKYVELAPKDSFGRLQSEACILAIKWKNDPTCYQTENFRAINTKEHDFSPIIGNKKGTQLIFTSNRPKSLGKDSPIWDALPEDLWVMNKEKGKGSTKWQPPVNATGLNTTDSEGAAVMDRKYTTIYFTRCVVDKKAKTSGCTIWKSRRQGPDKWNEPEKVELFPDSLVTGHPALTPNGLFMVFSSNAPGGKGGMDLWIAAYDKKTKDFANPKNLGKELNSPFNEMFPFIREDGTLYFASNRPEGMGGLDIFQAKLKQGSTNEWQTGENMRYPLNSEGDDFGIHFTPGAEAGYMTSNRKGGRGADDVYTFTIPKAKIILSGTVRDKDTKAVIPGAVVELKDAAGNTFKATTDATGFYKQEIPFGVAYDMTASKTDYFNDVNHATTMGLDPLRQCNDTTLSRDFLLKTQNVELEFDVQFYLGEDRWYAQYNDTLDKIIVIMKDNPKLVVELGAHTDARGSDESNKVLAEKRAAAVIKYLTTEGELDPKRFKPNGYGESSPRKLTVDTKGAETGYVFPKDTELTEDFINGLKKLPNGDKIFEDAHRLNRRVTVKKVSNDYNAPKEKTEDEGDDTN